MNVAFISIGSNIQPEDNIKKMFEVLRKSVTIIKTSSFVQTQPIGIENQPMFTNGAVKIETRLSHPALNLLLKKIEDQLGRDRSAPKFGPRTIDLDIIIWNGEVVDDDFYTRDFIRNSISEIS